MLEASNTVLLHLASRDGLQSSVVVRKWNFCVHDRNSSLFVDFSWNSIAEMRYTHAVVVRIPQAVKFDSKKQANKVDLAAARKQQEDLNDTLREVGFCGWF